MATARFEQTLEIGAAPEAVHALLCDLERLRVLHPLIESIRELEPRPEAPRARRYRVVDRFAFGPLRFRSAYVAELRAVSATEVEGRAWQSPGIALVSTYHLAPCAAGTRLVETTELRAPWPLLGFARRQGEAAHRRMLANAKRHLEGRDGSPR